MNTVNGGEICTRVALRPALNIFLHMRASTVLIIDFWFVVHFFAYNTYNSAGKYFWKIDSALDIFLRASAQFSSYLNKVQATAITQYCFGLHYNLRHYNKFIICLSSPRAKGFYWQTELPQWEGGRLFDGSAGFFYGNSCNSGTESRKMVSKVGN